MSSPKVGYLRPIDFKHGVVDMNHGWPKEQYVFKNQGPTIEVSKFQPRCVQMSNLEIGVRQRLLQCRYLPPNKYAIRWPRRAGIHIRDNQHALPNYTHPHHLPDATRMEQTLKPASKAWGAPTYLTQADVLQVLGPVLTARSDTFVIRAYGDAVDAAGKIQARA